MKAEEFIETLKIQGPISLKGRSLQGLCLEGADLSGLDLSGLDLSGANLSEAKLRGARLFMTNLQGADLTGADLTGADLTRANLKGADLEEATAVRAGFGASDLTGAKLFRACLDGATFTMADLTGADLKMASLKDARLRQAKIIKTDLTGACLQGADLALSDVTGADFDNADLRNTNLRMLRGFESASWIGVDIRDVNFAGAYMLRRFILDQNFLKEFKERGRLSKVLYYIWWATSDCGRSMLRWALWSILLVSIFGWLFTLAGVDYGQYRTPLSPFYYSVVTFTTLGYGDVVPASEAAQIIAIIEVVTGYIMLGGLISIFTNKIARRAD